MRTSVILFVAALSVSVAQAASRVVFVDNSRPTGNGTYESPFATLAEASRSNAEVIYVAEGTAPYEEAIALRRGQMLIGSAYGLDALRSDFKVDLNAPPMPAAQGIGPVIHGTITLAGDNVVAGCTMKADKTVGVALTAQAPQGPIDLRTMLVRTSDNAYALYLGDSIQRLTWSGGRIDATERGSGILINGGLADFTVDHVAIAGSFNRAVEVRDRTGGDVLFRNGSIRVDDASRDGVLLSKCRGSIKIDEPLQIKTTGGRGFVADVVQNVVLAAGPSIETINGTALEVHDSTVEMLFDRVSADGAAEGVVLDKVRGRLEIAGGTFKNAAIRLTQSTGGIRMRNINMAALFLRHVERAKFERITIDGGLTVSNSTEVDFLDVHVNGAAVDVDEAKGWLTFTRSTFSGAVTTRQQFNSGRLTFDGCELTGGPLNAVVEGGRLDVVVLSSKLPGIGILGKASGYVTGTIRGSRFEQGAGPAIAMRLEAASSGCFDAEGNTFAPSGSPMILLSAAGRLYLTENLGARNGGIPILIDAGVTSITSTCP